MKVEIQQDYYDKIQKAYQTRGVILDVPDARGQVLLKAGVAAEVMKKRPDGEKMKAADK